MTAVQGGEQLALYEGHKHESYKLDCCLTPSDGHVICGSEDGVRRCVASSCIFLHHAAGMLLPSTPGAMIHSATVLSL